MLYGLACTTTPDCQVLTKPQPQRSRDLSKTERLDQVCQKTNSQMLARKLRGNYLNLSEIGTSICEARALKTVHATNGRLLAVGRATRGNEKAERVPNEDGFPVSRVDSIKWIHGRCRLTRKSDRARSRPPLLQTAPLPFYSFQTHCTTFHNSQRSDHPT
jgi:hypothetical protein